jgi:type II secretory ATPase GspE/PulE/Tfp pilus assembly ATPase PilB-like protein
LLVAELLPIEGAVREAVLKQGDRMALFNAAAGLGWRGLWSKGLARASDGLTTSAELRRVLVPE